MSRTLMTRTGFGQHDREERRPRGATEIDAAIGRRIHEARRRLGMSQEALAGKIGVTFQQVQKYELGTNRITVGRLQLIADALATHPATFFDAEPLQSGRWPDPISPSERDFLAKLARVPVGVRESFAHLLDLLAAEDAET